MMTQPFSWVFYAYDTPSDVIIRVIIRVIISEPAALFGYEVVRCT